MAISQGPKSPGTITESGGSIVWNNPSNAATSDDVYAEANYVAGGIVGDFLDSTNFGFSIPPTAVIKGILVEMEVYQGGGGVRSHLAQLIKGGTPTGSNLGSGTSLPSVEAYVSYGDSANLWGTTWTPAEINSSDFGFRHQGESFGAGFGKNEYIDHVRVTVYYDLPGDLGLTF